MRELRCSLAAGLGLLLGLAGCAASPAEGAATRDESIVETQAPTDPDRSPGTGTMDGALAGSKVDVAEAVVFVGAITEREPRKAGARIILASRAGACGAPGVVPPGGALLTLDVELVDGKPAAGTYSVARGAVGGPGNVAARLEAANESCLRKTVVVSSGSLVIDEAKDGRVRGSFELTLGRDTVKGTFDAAPCAGASEPPLTLRCGG